MGPYATDAGGREAEGTVSGFLVVLISLLVLVLIVWVAVRMIRRGKDL